MIKFLEILLLILKLIIKISDYFYKTTDYSHFLKVKIS